MNRSEFETKLQDNLQSIPFEERENAMKYYREYFDDAGFENEQQVLAELESPDIIADGIKKDLGYDLVDRTVNPQEGKTASSQNHSEDTASGQTATGIPNPEFASEEKSNTNANTSKFPNDHIGFGRFQFPTWAVILFAILFVPVVIPVVSGVFGAAVGLFFGLIGMAIGFFAAAVGIFVGGIALVVWGITSIVAGMLFNGILLIGLGLAMIGLGLMFLVLAIQFFAVWIPQFFRWVVQLFRNGFQRIPARRGEYA
jgi:uncharacterized membrane protein